MHSSSSRREYAIIHAPPTTCSGKPRVGIGAGESAGADDFDGAIAETLDYCVREQSLDLDEFSACGARGGRIGAYCGAGPLLVVSRW